MSSGGTVALQVNNAPRQIEADADLPLIDALRDLLDLKGTRFGCGAGQCGACFVLVGGHPMPSCDTPLWAVAGKSITTVEGLGTPAAPHPLQQAFIDEQAGAMRLLHVRHADLGGSAAAPQSAADRRPRSGTRWSATCAAAAAHNRIVRAVLRAAAGNRHP